MELRRFASSLVSRVGGWVLRAVRAGRSTRTHEALCFADRVGSNG